MTLVYINELGPNYKGDNIYEFIFSDLDDVWGDEWDAEPASGKPSPPDINYVKKVGVLKNSDIELNLIQNSDFFGVYDAIDGVIALGWENMDDYDEYPEKRLAFHFGEDIKTVEAKLYEHDLILEYKKERNGKLKKEDNQ
jgi:hypothetical protein